MKSNISSLKSSVPGGPRRAVCFLTLLAGFLLGPWNFFASAAAAPTHSLIVSWLAVQTNVQTWSADFVQTRTLKSLVQPLTATGHLYFAQPNRFRWELGQPAQTLAVRDSNEMVVIYPRLKRAERYRLDGRQTGPWRDALALLEAGFPRSQAAMEEQFRLASQTVTNGACELELVPKAAAARRLMPCMKISFATNDFMLLATELEFADGSTLRNDFARGGINAALDATLFTPKIAEDFKIVEPLKNHP